MAMDYPLSAVLDTKEKKGLFSVKPSSAVIEAVELMNRERIGAVLVMDEDHPVGIFTERDVLARVVATGRDSARTLVESVMTSNLIGVRLTTTVDEAMQVVTSKRCRHLPVTDDGGNVVGMVSIGDLTRWVVRDRENRIEDLTDYITGRYPV